jgi:hypothetical protein
MSDTAPGTRSRRHIIDCSVHGARESLLRTFLEPSSCAVISEPQRPWQPVAALPPERPRQSAHARGPPTVQK